MNITREKDVTTVTECCANMFQVEVWKGALQPVPQISGPEGRGWEMTEGILDIKWCVGSILPDDLVDILCDQPATPPVQDQSRDDDIELINLCDAIEEEEEDEDFVIDYDDFDFQNQFRMFCDELINVRDAIEDKGDNDEDFVTDEDKPLTA